MRRADGFSLIELLISMSLLGIVLGTLIIPLTTAQREQQRDQNYATEQQDANFGLESMVAQIRQATSLITTGPNEVEMNVTLSGAYLTVFYACDVAQPGTSYRECIRLQTSQGSTLPSISANCSGTYSTNGCRVVLMNLTNGTTSNPVFSWGTDPNAPDYMSATIAVPASGGQAYDSMSHTIVFSDGALMRNLEIQN